MKRSLLVLSLVFLPSTLSAEEPAAVVTPDAAGCWSGMWYSCDTGHKGPLQAKICKVSEDCYEAHFLGRFAAIIPFRYTATMQVTGRDADKLFLTSSRRLPLMGTFEMNAVVTATEFNAEYTSRNDKGKFVMTRK